MNVRNVEEVILSAAGPSWTKVAMVLARVAKAMGGDFVEDGRWETISTRIQELVKNGQLEARGDTTNWRGSEIRRAG